MVVIVEVEEQVVDLYPDRISSVDSHVAGGAVDCEVSSQTVCRLITGPRSIAAVVSIRAHGATRWRHFHIHIYGQLLGLPVVGCRGANRWFRSGDSSLACTAANTRCRNSPSGAGLELHCLDTVPRHGVCLVDSRVNVLGDTKWCC